MTDTELTNLFGPGATQNEQYLIIKKADFPAASTSKFVAPPALVLAILQKAEMALSPQNQSVIAQRLTVEYKFQEIKEGMHRDVYLFELSKEDIPPPLDPMRF